MEQEIDLRPYILAIVRRWRMIVLIMLAAALITGIFASLRPPTQAASATLMILATNSEMRFDQRFVTANDSPFTNPATQREALIALASSSTIEAQARANLPDDLRTQLPDTGDFARRMNVQTSGDLLRITAKDADVQRANTLVETWAQAYVQTVNEIYSKDNTLVQGIETEIKAAQQRYDTAQQELETFIGSSRQVQVEQQIKGLEALLDGSREAGQALYTQYLSRTRELDLLVSDAQTLRQQIASGESNDLASGLAALALRARVAGGQPLPVDLRFDNPGALQQGEGASLSTLDRLIAVVQQRRNDLLQASQQLAQALATGTPSGSGLTPDLRTQYEQELTTLKQEQEQLRAQQSVLTQRRDIALESLSILGRKLDEQRIASGTNQAEVRLIGTTVDPLPSALARVLLPTAIAAVVATLLGTIAALGMELLRARPAAVRASSPGDRPAADHPMTS